MGLGVLSKKLDITSVNNYSKIVVGVLMLTEMPTLVLAGR